jgi:chromate transporter
MTELELFARFVVISLLAFGGGQAALPLVERVTVAETGWISAQDFATAAAFGYVTPGPVLITATFIGYRVAGITGAFAATVGAFLAPWGLAVLASHTLRRAVGSRWLMGFGKGAAPAVIGLLGVTAFSLGRSAFGSWPSIGWPFVAIAVAALVLSVKTKVHPVLILLGGALSGAVAGAAASAI